MAFVLVAGPPMVWRPRSGESTAPRQREHGPFDEPSVLCTRTCIPSLFTHPPASVARFDDQRGGVLRSCPSHEA